MLSMDDRHDLENLEASYTSTSSSRMQQRKLSRVKVSYEDTRNSSSTVQLLPKIKGENDENDDVLESFQQRAQSFLTHISSIGESLVKTGKKTIDYDRFKYAVCCHKFACLLKVRIIG